ncbi:MAG: hypothetical protein P8X76_08235 [Maritimibacter sp.]
MSTAGETCVLGLDFGSDSVRAVVVRVADGAELASGVAEYERWMQGKYCDPTKQKYRQHPSDYMESMTSAVRSALSELSATPPKIVGIGVDTTGSSPIPVADDGVALALKDGFSEDPDAMCILWKDHTAVQEAEDINKLSQEEGQPDYITMLAASIPRNGTGPRSCISPAPTRPPTRLPPTGLNSATGFRRC